MKDKSREKRVADTKGEAAERQCAGIRPQDDSQRHLFFREIDAFIRNLHVTYDREWLLGSITKLFGPAFKDIGAVVRGTRLHVVDRPNNNSEENV